MIKSVVGLKKQGEREKKINTHQPTKNLISISPLQRNFCIMDNHYILQLNINKINITNFQKKSQKLDNSNWKQIALGSFVGRSDN